MTTRAAVTPALLEEYCTRFRNWGRWGPEDEIGTLNFITPNVITRAARLVRQGRVISCALNFDTGGPQTGAFGRVNPIHSMVATGTDHATGRQRLAGFETMPYGWGFADDQVTMFLQCGTQWDGLGDRRRTKRHRALQGPDRHPGRAPRYRALQGCGRAPARRGDLPRGSRRLRCRRARDRRARRHRARADGRRGTAAPGGELGDLLGRRRAGALLPHRPVALRETDRGACHGHLGRGGQAQRAPRVVPAPPPRHGRQHGAPRRRDLPPRGPGGGLCEGRRLRVHVCGAAAADHPGGGFVHQPPGDQVRGGATKGLVVTRQDVVHPGRPGESSGCQVITHPDQEAWMNVHKNARWGSAWMWAGRSTSCTPWPASAVALPRLTGRDRVAFEDQRAAAVTPSQPRA